MRGRLALVCPIQIFHNISYAREECDPMATTDLRMRLALLRIDDDTRANLKRFRPILERQIDAVIDGFYRFLREVPEARAILTSDEQVRQLRAKQRSHWLVLFSGTWDGHFRDAAIAIGAAHFNARVPPYLYVAAYTYFHCELINVAASQFNGEDAARVTAAIAKIVNLDMELALASYMRVLWTSP